MDNIEDGGPAFPQVNETSGMSLRDWFAGQALAGIVANPKWDMLPLDQAAVTAYIAADEMLARRKPKTEA